MISEIKYPLYLQAYASGRLDKAIEEGYRLLESCAICPRKCRVNRLKDQKGYCKIGLNARVYSFTPHHGEEPPISGKNGSGAIFFSGCNLSCVYCQNYQFSQAENGRELQPEELGDIMLGLQNKHCHNINLVTPTHVMPQILKALSAAIKKGLNIPLVYNTSGYELPRIVKLLKGIADIYLVDMRYFDNDKAVKYSNAPDYPEYNQGAVKEMHRQVGIAKFDPDGIIRSGVIIRHLVLPGGVSGTKGIAGFIAREVSPDTYISLMSQYLPCYKADQLKEISRRISLKEYEAAKEALQKFGLNNGWIQEEYGLEAMAGIHIRPAKV
ncbi:MAG: radical SAM protein [Candidatus Omnitrophica bacterium]|nr:radical SAM protein [Candidatus Omnitrophota bacterium]